MPLDATSSSHRISDNIYLYREYMPQEPRPRLATLVADIRFRLPGGRHGGTWRPPPRRQSVMTLGFYEIYWMYEQWKAIRGVLWTLVLFSMANPE